MIITCWKWKRADGTELFTAKHVNTLQSMLARHLHMDHRLLCLTDDTDGLDGDILTWPITQFTDTPRCRRRMVQYSKDFAALVGPRFFSMDLDVVLVDDITPLLRRTEPLVAYWIEYAHVFGGGLILMDTGYLDPLFQMFALRPDIFPKLVQPHGIASDQAMLNWYLAKFNPAMGRWTAADGIVLYFGKGYERDEHHGVGPTRTTLPPCTRMVVLGGADLSVLDERRFDWVEAWQ